MGDGASVQRMRRWGRLLLPLASALAVAAVAAVVAVLTMPHHDTTDAAGQKQLAVGGFTFHYPATWHKINAGDHKHPAEAAVPSVFLASMPMRGNCARTSDGIARRRQTPAGTASDSTLASESIAPGTSRRHLDLICPWLSISILPSVCTPSPHTLHTDRLS
jgi:hypothetical protein